MILKIGSFLAEVVACFAVAFLIQYVLLFIWHGKGRFDWRAALRLAVILGVILPLWSRIKGFF